MNSYRIYFWSQAAIVGRDDFEAKNDESALWMAELLCEACSDRCDSFDLWQGRRRVGSSLSGPRAGVVEMTPQIQEELRRRQEAIRDSRWPIAESRRLLERIRQLEPQGSALEGAPPANRDRARRWQMKAEELRAVAEQMPNPLVRDTYRRLAEAYETLARHEPAGEQESKPMTRTGGGRG
jgi:hypothetical protein